MARNVWVAEPLTSHYTDADRTLALGGVFQAARIARDIARSGVCDAAAFEVSRDSLFDFDPQDVAGVFGGEAGVTAGLRVLIRQLQQPGQRDLEVSRYAVALMHLADRLRRSGAAMQGLAEDLSALARRRSSFDLADNVLHEQLGKIYQERISILGPRIMVRGEPLHLQNPDNAARIRVSLLAGIRAAVLWRQAGGSKWQFMLRRKRILALGRELVDKTVT